MYTVFIDILMTLELVKKKKKKTVGRSKNKVIKPSKTIKTNP